MRKKAATSGLCSRRPSAIGFKQLANRDLMVTQSYFFACYGHFA